MSAVVRGCDAGPRLPAGLKLAEARLRSGRQAVLRDCVEPVILRSRAGASAALAAPEEPNLGNQHVRVRLGLPTVV